MNAKEQLYYLLEHYHIGNYTTDVFADEFSRIYELELDYEALSNREYILMKELSEIAGRFSLPEEDLAIPSAFFGENDVRKKAEEIYLKLAEDNRGPNSCEERENE